MFTTSQELMKDKLLGLLDYLSQMLDNIGLGKLSISLDILLVRLGYFEVIDVETSQQNKE